MTRQEAFDEINKIQDEYIAELIALMNNPAYDSMKMLNFTSPTGTGKTKMMSKLIKKYSKSKYYFIITTLSKGQLHIQIRDNLAKDLIGYDNYYVYGSADFRVNSKLDAETLIGRIPKGSKCIWLRDEGHIRTNKWDEVLLDVCYKVINFSATNTHSDIQCNFTQTMMLRTVNQTSGTPEDAINKLLEIKKAHKSVKGYNPCAIFRCVSGDIGLQKMIEDLCKLHGLKYIDITEETYNIQEICEDDNKYDVIINKFKIVEGIDIRRAHVLYMDNQPGNNATTIQVIGRCRRNALLYRNDIDILDSKNKKLLDATRECYVYYNVEEMKVDEDENGELQYAFCNHISVQSLKPNSTIYVDNGQLENGLYIIELTGYTGKFNIDLDWETGFNIINPLTHFYDKELSYSSTNYLWVRIGKSYYDNRIFNIVNKYKLPLIDGCYLAKISYDNIKKLPIQERQGYFDYGLASYQLANSDPYVELYYKYDNNGNLVKISKEVYDMFITYYKKYSKDYLYSLATIFDKKVLNDINIKLYTKDDIIKLMNTYKHKHRGDTYKYLCTKLSKSFDISKDTDIQSNVFNYNSHNVPTTISWKIRRSKKFQYLTYEQALYYSYLILKYRDKYLYSEYDIDNLGENIDTLVHIYNFNNIEIFAFMEYIISNNFKIRTYDYNEPSLLLDDGHYDLALSPISIQVNPNLNHIIDYTEHIDDTKAVHIKKSDIIKFFDLLDKSISRNLVVSKPIYFIDNCIIQYTDSVGEYNDYKKYDYLEKLINKYIEFLNNNLNFIKDVYSKEYRFPLITSYMSLHEPFNKDNDCHLDKKKYCTENCTRCREFYSNNTSLYLRDIPVLYDSYIKQINDYESAIIGTDLMRQFKKDDIISWIESRSVSSKVGNYNKFNTFISTHYVRELEQAKSQYIKGKNNFNLDKKCNSVIGYCVEYYSKYLLYGKDFLDKEIKQALKESKVKEINNYIIIRACQLKYKDMMTKSFGQGVSKLIQTISVSQLITKKYIDFVKLVMYLGNKTANFVRNELYLDKEPKNNLDPNLSIRHIAGLADYVTEDTILDVKVNGNLNEGQVRQVLAYHYLSTKRSDLNIKRVIVYDATSGRHVSIDITQENWKENQPYGYKD